MPNSIRQYNMAILTAVFRPRKKRYYWRCRVNRFPLKIYSGFRRKWLFISFQLNWKVALRQLWLTMLWRNPFRRLTHRARWLVRLNLTRGRAPAPARIIQHQPVPQQIIKSNRKTEKRKILCNKGFVQTRGTVFRDTKALWDPKENITKNWN